MIIPQYLVGETKSGNGIHYKSWSGGVYRFPAGSGSSQFPHSCSGSSNSICCKSGSAYQNKSKAWKKKLKPFAWTCLQK